MPTQKSSLPSKSAAAETKPVQAVIKPARRKSTSQVTAAVDTRIETKAVVKSGKMRGRSVTVLLEPDEIVREQVGGFVNFLREHAIVGLAVGFVIGTQAQAVVKQLITSFIDPAFALFFGGSKLSTRTFELSLWGNQSTFLWGAMAYALINLLFVLAAIYALIKIFKLDKLDKKKDAAAKEAETEKAAKVHKAAKAKTRKSTSRVKASTS